MVTSDGASLHLPCNLCQQQSPELRRCQARSATDDAGMGDGWSFWASHPRAFARTFARTFAHAFARAFARAFVSTIDHVASPPSTKCGGGPPAIRGLRHGAEE